MGSAVSLYPVKVCFVLAESSMYLACFTMVLAWLHVLHLPAVSEVHVRL